MKIVGLAGWSGAGKTTLLVEIIELLTVRGLRVSTIKHADHEFDVDMPGKDSHRHRTAGASEVLVASSRRCALVHELRTGREPVLRDLLQHLSPVDLVIVEGYKRETHPKVEVHRTANGKPYLFPTLTDVRGLVTDGPRPRDWSGPTAILNDPQEAADLLLRCAAPLSELLANPTSGDLASLSRQSG
jgi:molybdopterin-guanine dinucleotide biosynthesis adapter protein